MILYFTNFSDFFSLFLRSWHPHHRGKKSWFLISPEATGQKENKYVTSMQYNLRFYLMISITLGLSNKQPTKEPQAKFSLWHQNGLL